MARRFPSRHGAILFDLRRAGRVGLETVDDPVNDLRAELDSLG